jgi:hypothetical protein
VRGGERLGIYFLEAGAARENRIMTSPKVATLLMFEDIQ